MRAFTGTFLSRAAGERAARRIGSIIGDEHVKLLTPESRRETVKAVPTTEDMPPIGAPMGATVGGALGIAAAVMIPGVGQATAIGLAAAALFGAAGGVLGWKAGDAADRALSGGLPADEVYFYEDAVRQGRTVLVALIEDPDKEDVVKKTLSVYGAESIDAARDRWWMGLRDAEAEHYDGGERVDDHERLYRYGFTAAATNRALSRVEDLDLWPYLDPHERSVVQRGFERGRQTQRTRAREQAA